MIRAYIGLLGEGKTLAMVMDACKIMKRGKRVISNVPMKFKSGIFKKKYYESENYTGKEFENAILKAENCLVCIDEASIVFPSYFWQNIPGEFLMKWAQSRKYAVDIFYTTQRFTHSVKRLRDITNEVVKCKKSNDMYSFIHYDPEYFEGRMIPSLEIEKKFIIKRRIIMPWTAIRHYKYYDTLYKVKSSVLLNIDESKVSNDFIEEAVEDKWLTL